MLPPLLLLLRLQLANLLTTLSQEVFHCPRRRPSLHHHYQYPLPRERLAEGHHIQSARKTKALRRVLQSRRWSVKKGFWRGVLPRRSNMVHSGRKWLTRVAAWWILVFPRFEIMIRDPLCSTLSIYFSPTSLRALFRVMIRLPNKLCASTPCMYITKHPTKSCWSHTQPHVKAL